MTRELIFDCRQSDELLDQPFYTLLCAAFRRADRSNLERLRTAFPEVYEAVKRYERKFFYAPAEDY